MLVWRRLAPAKWEDVWLERLRFLGPERLAITSFPDASTVRIEAYGVSKKEAGGLVKKFGGQLRIVKANQHFKPRPSVPIRIRQSLVVFGSEAERTRFALNFSERKQLVIPAAMAFGTGEHATTAQCLRFLCDAATELRGSSWEMLDLGTGSGILAIAARRLGASRAQAFDFDVQAVRTARENARINGVDRIAIRRTDVTKWSPGRTWEVVAANLYSEVLLQSAETIAHALAPGGRLFVSGILRTQAADCISAFAARGLRLEKTAKRGKWVTTAWRPAR